MIPHNYWILNKGNEKMKDNIINKNENNIINTRINLIISIQLLWGLCIFGIIIGIGLTYNNKNIQIMGVISYIIYILLFSAIFNIFNEKYYKNV